MSADTQLCLHGLGMTNDDLQTAAVDGRLVDLERLLSYPNLDPAVELDRAMGLAAQAGHMAVVERLLQDRRVVESTDISWLQYGLRWASANGHTAVVEVLMRHPCIDPTDDGTNHPLLWAAQSGHSGVVKLLMVDRRVDPSVGRPAALWSASRGGHLTTLELLLRDSRSILPLPEFSFDEHCLVFEFDSLAVIERLMCGGQPRCTRLEVCRHFGQTPIPLRAMQLHAPKLSSVLSRLGLNANASTSVLKQALRLNGLEKKAIEELMNLE
jgi:Ankyrin repeats (3 copies)